MTIAILSLVILGQIALFQVLAALANRSIMRQEFALLETIPDYLEDHARRAPVIRIGIGAALGGLALLPLIGLPAGSSAAVMLLAGVSLASVAAFFRATSRDREMMRRLAGLTPGGNVRRASLERRSLSQWYHPVLDAIPVLLIVATLVWLVSVPGFITADASAFDEVRTTVLVLVGLQAVFVFASLFYSQRKGVEVKSITTYIPSLRRRPEVELRLSEELAGTQVRFFVFARICIAALLGVVVVAKILAAAGDPSVPIWTVARWGILAVFLAGFALYLKNVGRVSRRMQAEMELPNDEIASQG